jgi:hypothetical protein
MPIDKYMVLRKAAEVEEIASRMQIISDINAAFSGNSEKILDLNKKYTELMGFEIEWKATEGWESKLAKYAR